MSNVSKVILKITGMHCTSCAISIDFELEDLGVKSKTNYAKQQTEVEFDPQKISIEKILNTIKKIGYTADISS